MPEVMKPHVEQSGLAADAIPVVGNVAQRPCGRAAGEEEGAIGAVARNGVDKSARGLLGQQSFSTTASC